MAFRWDDKPLQHHHFFQAGNCLYFLRNRSLRLSMVFQIFSKSVYLPILWNLNVSMDLLRCFLLGASYMFLYQSPIILEHHKSYVYINSRFRDPPFRFIYTFVSHPLTTQRSVATAHASSRPAHAGDDCFWKFLDVWTHIYRFCLASTGMCWIYSCARALFIFPTVTKNHKKKFVGRSLFGWEERRPNRNAISLCCNGKWTGESPPGESTGETMEICEYPVCILRGPTKIKFKGLSWPISAHLW